MLVLYSIGLEQILCRKSISMLTGLKVTSLEGKYVFYTLELNTKGGAQKLNSKGLEKQKWNMTTDRA